jgi:hypothetical protein
MCRLIRLESLTKDYGTFRALDEVSLSLDPGVVGLLEQGIAHQEEASLASGFLGQFPQAQTVLESAASGDPLAARHQGWSWLLLLCPSPSCSGESRRR